MGAASATDAAIQKKKKKDFGLGTTTLIFSNEDLNDIIKIIKSVEDSSLLIKCVTVTVFLSMLETTLGTRLRTHEKSHVKSRQRNT